MKHLCAFIQLEKHSNAFFEMQPVFWLGEIHQRQFPIYINQNHHILNNTFTPTLFEIKIDIGLGLGLGFPPCVCSYSYY